MPKHLSNLNSHSNRDKTTGGLGETDHHHRQTSSQPSHTERKPTGHTGHQAVTKHPLHPVKQPLRQESLCLNIQSTARFAAFLHAIKTQTAT